MKLLNHFSDIADRYDTILCDVWGVLHCGGALLPGVPGFLDGLKRSPAKLILFSNSGRLSNRVRRDLAEKGITDDHVQAIVTSGDVLFEALKSGSLSLDRRSPRSLHFFSQARLEDWVTISGLRHEEDLDQAEALCLIHMPEMAELNGLDTLLARGVKNHLPLLCANPDMVSPRTDGFVEAPGHIARLYESLGGSVQYFGKPHPAIYHFARDQVLDGDLGRVLAIGDSIDHDFRGSLTIGADFLYVESAVDLSSYEEKIAALAQDPVCDAAIAAMQIYRTPALRW